MLTATNNNQNIENNIIENEIKDFASVLKIPNFQYEFKDDDDRDNYITELFHKYGDNLLDHNLFIKSANLNNDEEELRLLFWKTRFNKDWILLTKDIIVNYFEFKDNKNTYSHFIERNLLPNFKENDDYKVVEILDEIVQNYIKNSFPKNGESELFGNRSKLYIITGYCFKQLMMKYSKIARSLFIKVESLASFAYLCIKEYNKFKKCEQYQEQQKTITLEYETKLQIEQKEKEQLNRQIIQQQKEIEHNKELAEKEKQELKKKLDEHIKYSIKFKSSKIFIKRGYFYNISSKHLSRKGNEKTGITGNLIHRLSPYRTSSPNTEDDKLYYTDYFQVQYPELFENYINGLFDSLREDPDREFLKIRYPFLSKIIYEFKKCHDKICEYFDEEMKFMDNINNDIVWDENINFISDDEIKNIDTIMNNTPYILITNNGIIHNITENNKDEFKNNLIKEGLVKDNNYHMIKQTLKKNGSIKCDKDYDVNIKDILSNMSTLLFNLINVKTIYNNKIYPITNIK